MTNIIRELVAEFQVIHPDEKPPNGSTHYIILALGVAQQFIMDRIGGAEFYWEELASAVKSSFPPGSNAYEYKAFKSMFNSTCGMVSQWGSDAAPSMCGTWNEFIKWEKQSREPRLERFLEAQELDYERVVSELTSGNKRTHWIWYIFPQVEGLGRSETAIRYALQNRAEVEAYINHPVLYPRLLECTQLVLNHSFMKLEQVLPQPDNLKFISSMTAFMFCAPEEPIFQKALNIFNEGNICIRTAEFLSDRIHQRVIPS